MVAFNFQTCQQQKGSKVLWLVPHPLILFWSNRPHKALQRVLAILSTCERDEPTPVLFFFSAAVYTTITQITSSFSSHFFFLQIWNSGSAFQGRKELNEEWSKSKVGKEELKNRRKGVRKKSKERRKQESKKGKESN